MPRFRFLPRLFVLASDDAGQLADDGDKDGGEIVNQFEKRFFLDAGQRGVLARARACASALIAKERDFAESSS